MQSFPDKHIGRIVFGVATAVMFFALAEAAANLLGTSLIGGRYSVGRLLELGAILMIVVIAQLLRQIRDQLRADGR